MKLMQRKHSWGLNKSEIDDVQLFFFRGFALELSNEEVWPKED